MECPYCAKAMVKSGTKYTCRKCRVSFSKTARGLDLHNKIGRGKKTRK